MDRKYQIFVSSTYEDLRDERNEVIKACLNIGHIPVGMEMFNAADEEQWAVITRTIDQCDYYVVIVAHRYGSTVDGISFTEKEYDYAITQGIPVLGFIIAENAPWPNTMKDERADALKALKRFKTKVKQKMVRFWHTAPELRSQFVESLATTLNVNPRRGWVRAPEASGADIAQALSNLTEENARLRQALDEKKQSYSMKNSIDDIVEIISQQILDHGPQEVNATGFVIELIQSMNESAFHRLSLSEIMDQFCQYDPDQARDLLNELVIMGVLGRPAYDDYELRDISSQVYAKLVRSKNRTSS